MQEKRAHKKRKLIAVICLAVFAVFGLYFCYTEIFVYQRLSVSYKGNSPYTEEEIAAFIEVDKGTPLLAVDKQSIEKNLKYRLPYIKNIEISYKLPSTLSLELKFEKAAYYINIKNALYVLSEDLKVLEKTENIERIELDSLILLEFSEIKKCVAGEKLELERDVEKTLKQISSAIKKYGNFSDILAINLVDRFNMTLTCTSRFSVKLGDFSNIDTKIRFMYEVIKDKAASEIGGMIDVSDEDAREAIFKKYG